MINFIIINVILSVYNIIFSSFQNRNVIFILISIEIIYLNSSLLFFLFSYILDDILGLIYILVIILISGTEVIVILTIIILFYKRETNLIIKCI